MTTGRINQISIVFTRLKKYETFLKLIKYQYERS